MSRGSEDYKQEVLSSLSDLSAAKLEAIKTAIELIQNGSGFVTANYTDTVNNKAYKDPWPEYPPTTAPRETGTVYSAAEYLKIISEDNVGVGYSGSKTTYNFLFVIF